MFKRADREKITQARRLRRDATDVERRLWWKLRELNEQGFHFRRQAPFRAYILDFAEHHERLVVELDGGQHDEPVRHAHDLRRDQFLASQGYRTLRFRNLEVLDNIDGVMDRILQNLGEIGHRPPPGSLCSPTSPQRGR
ncbi:MAG: endonuclease domain-containing protein [Alphaproteobacteria bacterium]|nr:DUF559 domain-containing protein [Alphaproteobacteria bacterium]MDE2112938.1 endonuclease domain-containing protein [Alphaproteobacteria bacterium]MDE2495912.1 endonuclease domain-containing protein [Alphaproteobacteria bacterium]